MADEYVDVLVVGAGISGIGAGWHLQRYCPGKSYAILEARDQLGGTWDLFRYPGVRSDSDMHTLGYSFKPWTKAKAIADGPAILDYLNETADENDIRRHIRFGHRVLGASWSSEDAAWTIEAERGPDREPVRIRANFLFMCSGYYDYAAGYTPDFEGLADYRGEIVHPQKWSDAVDYAGKRVVVIGSGATAVTLIPELARDAAHVVMLQRSPTYMVSRPAEDGIANRLRAMLPARTAYRLTRWKNVLYGMYFFRMCRRSPARVKAKLIDMVRATLPADYDVETHFTPRYNPWDQRLCLVPDNDFFDALGEGSASIVTDRIERFTERGIKLESGRELEADMVVTATGLNLQFFGGATISVDGEAQNFGGKIAYKGMMYDDVPNFASSFGYTNASWTLKADLTCAYVCRLLNHMDRTRTRIATPRLADTGVEPEPWVDFSSGYFQRALDKLPKQGSKHPWRLHQNYARDILLLRYGKVDDGVMEFARPPATARAPLAQAA
ncbi:MAG: NAD(P)/FAD-dependent oxidoreductase [Sphingomonadaceae bacterium]|nr:NAD(P)/FAD-dependent oxidoreductase [Sphingomonadaceae bacterium]